MGQVAVAKSRFSSNKIDPLFNFDREEEEHNEARRQLLLDVAVAHYMPATFPLSPVMNSKVVQVCKESWKIILSQVDEETGASGFTLFYTEFYMMLAKFDSTGKFEAVLSSHASHKNLISAKSAILSRIVSFVLSMDFDNPQQLKYSVHMLGKSHAHKQIRPWQYSVFIQTLLNTLAYRLGSHATHEVMCAWVNCFAFVMKGMLRPAIKNQIVETEINANTCALGGDSIKQLQAVEERRLGKSPDSTIYQF